MQEEPDDETLGGLFGALEHANGPDETFAVQQKVKRKFGANWRDKTKRTNPTTPATTKTTNTFTKSTTINNNANTTARNA